MQTARSPTRLVIAAAADGVSHIFADNVDVTFVGNDTFSAIMMLLASYFAWDLCYPRAYQFCSFVYAHVLGEEAARGRKSHSVVKLDKQISQIKPLPSI